MADDDEETLSNSAEQLIFRAALDLEENEDVDAAIAALREAIGVATVAGRTLELIRAKTFLGELLLGTGKEKEARQELQDVLEAAAVFKGAPEQIDQEVEAARELLARSSSTG